ncbi:MAG: helix-turn-helix domain-containing protein [candidate division WOR-3 bacterium]
MNETVEKIEREMIEMALKKHNNNQTRAAEELGISERVLRYKIKKYRIKI